MDLMEAVPVLVPGVLTTAVVHRLVTIPPMAKTTVDPVFIGVDQTARLNVPGDEGGLCCRTSS